MLAKQLCGRRGRGRLGAGRVGSGRRQAQLTRGGPGTLRQPGKPPHAGPRPPELPGSFCRLRAAHVGSPLCPTGPVIHRATLGLACVSCRIQLNFQDGTDNAEFYPGTLESRAGQRNPPPHPFMFQKSLLRLQPMTILPTMSQMCPLFP